MEQKLLKEIKKLADRMEALENHVAEIDVRSEAMFFPVLLDRTQIGNDSFGYRPITSPDLEVVK